jgi:uroporphyrinogen III methyltransferase/synthase
MSDRPLIGQSILLTRPVHQSWRMADRLRALGAEAVEAPTVTLEPPDDWSPVDAALRRLKEYAWLVLTSANGVTAACERMLQLDIDGRALAHLRIAAIGPATALELRRHFLIADVVPDEFVAEALAESLKPLDLQGCRCLLLRSNLARQTLRDALVAAGAECDDIAIYRTARPDSFPEAVRQRLLAGSIDWVTFTSSSTFDNFVSLLGSDAREMLQGVRIASIGPITSAAIRKAGFEPAVEARDYTVEGLVDAIVGLAQ